MFSQHGKSAIANKSQRSRLILGINKSSVNAGAREFWGSYTNRADSLKVCLATVPLIWPASQASIKVFVVGSAREFAPRQR